ncbi:phospholipase/carboxylesterase [Nonlabens sp. Hel1_33_55]|uniref:alpha/beta hydrolase n=1 Tax=Nonlabens sp. Hel1_33_55 TaxID=1336802 RepID=UPI000875D941|nr:alpha/beta hydrolase-fold protein [Nonlabens sp. Hel1_33_55]SCY10987.1 phospholipase/carboxylesterase [Nonlabens sp. Hel1_33_55]
MNTDLSLQYISRPADKANAPLLILVHGYGSNEQDLFSFAPQMDKGIHIISVRAPYDLPPYGAAWYAIDYTADKGKFSDLNQARESIQLLKTFIVEIVDRYNVNKESVNILGFSQGAILSMAMALSDPTIFRNVVAMSGYLNEDLVEDINGLESRFRESELKTNFFISHGTMDQVIPFDWAMQVQPVMEKLNVDYLFKQYPMGHGVSPENFHDMKKWLEERL